MELGLILCLLFYGRQSAFLFFLSTCC
ncbi:rCG46247 [Rattus norvegicus]|uniref:RCG46247 n=1 Tax=Rattus norvegicus TaxID=10116 RepID=A6IBW1_RAT|nr:rCG46247 [Rattus norvegicus]